MRIAVSETHRAGKSTLVEDLAEWLRGHRVVDEPYHLLEEEGFELRPARARGLLRLASHHGATPNPWRSASTKLVTFGERNRRWG